jgi:hypothetical protein
MPTLIIMVNAITAIKEGNESHNKSRILTLSAKNIIKVVTSPVISDTPPELTENTTKTAKRIVLLAGNDNDSNRAMETSVAVMLSARDEKIKLKVTVNNINFRLLMDPGIARCNKLVINPFLLR